MSTVARPLVVLVVLALLVAGCGGDAGSDAQIVEVTLTDQGCEPAEITVEEGLVEFHVSNNGSGAVTEFEILGPGDRVMGEVENVAPGLHREFKKILEPGSFVTYCPGGTTERGTLVVTASS